jgi:hypothetical protein
LRVEHGSTAPLSVLDTTGPLMLPRSKRNGEAPKVINPSGTKEINHGVCSGDDEQSCEPAARAGSSMMIQRPARGLVRLWSEQVLNLHWPQQASKGC